MSPTKKASENEEKNNNKSKVHLKNKLIWIGRKYLSQRCPPPKKQNNKTLLNL